MPMKILHVIHSIDPRSGGPSHAIRSMAREQARAGHDVAVLTTTVQSAEPWASRQSYTGRMDADPDFSNVELHLAPAFGRRKPWCRYAFSPEAARWLQQRLNDELRGPDVVHIHGTFSHVTSAAAVAARRSGIPYILRPAGSLNRRCFSRGRRRLKQLFNRLYLDNDLRCAARVQAMSSAEADELDSCCPGIRVCVIPHGVAVPSLERPHAERVLFDRFPELRGRRVVLFLGRLDAKKRPEIAIEAIARLQSQYANIALLLAGPDAGHSDVIQDVIARFQLQDRIVLGGFLQGEIKAAAFRASDVFVLPSLDENFGVAVAEAMAHGTPVLLTPGVATHRFVQESGAGLTVEGQPAAFAHGLAKLLSGDREEIGARGRRFVEQNLSWPAVIRQLDELYAGVSLRTRAASGSC